MMIHDFDKLILPLSTTLLSTDVLQNLILLLKQQNIQSSPTTYQSLLTLAHCHEALSRSKDQLKYVDQLTRPYRHHTPIW